MSKTPPQQIVFHSLDWDAEIDIKARNLPHWFQANAAIFVTFRTADSLPVKVRLRLVEELRNWLAIHSLPLQLADSVFEAKTANFDRIFGELEVVRQREFQKLTSQLLHRSLDESHGECLLRNRSLANIVAETIWKFDGDRYDLDSFVIMPNHIHGIIIINNQMVDTGRGVSHTPIFNPSSNNNQGVCNTPLRSPSNTIGAIVRGYKSAVTKQINILGSGKYKQSSIVWQRSFYEHIIRNDESYQNISNYIVNNPSKWLEDRYR
jgi:REP element-mobilizing transposase RayT